MKISKFNLNPTSMVALINVVSSLSAANDSYPMT